MSRTLHRPMFRRGGSTGEGITSGLRQRYGEGESVKIEDIVTQKIPEPPKSTSGADFWLNLGTNILAQPGGRPILQTLGTAGQEPLLRYQQQRSQEDLLKYKHAQGERQFQLEIYKALSDDDKIALAEKIKYLMDEHGLSKEEALNRALPEFRKPRDPKEQELLDTEYERDLLNTEIAKIQSGLSKEGSYVSAEQAKKIYDFYKQADSEGWRYEADEPFIDLASIQEEWRGEGKKQEDWLSPEGNIAISPDQQSDYTEGYYYVDSFTGDVYQVGPGSTELIKVVLDEEELPLPLNDPFAKE